MYASPDRRLVFDVNDFDETLPAPFDWDIKRLAASFAVAARENGFDDHHAHAAARSTARSYRTEMAKYAAMRFLEVWYSRIDVEEVSRQFDALQTKQAVRRRHRDIEKARRSTSLRAFLKMSEQVGSVGTDGDVPSEFLITWSERRHREPGPGPGPPELLLGDAAVAWPGRRGQRPGQPAQPPAPELASAP